MKKEKKPVNKLKAVLISGVVFVLITAFLGVLLNDTTINTGLGSLDEQYGFVMSSVENITVANPRYIDIAQLAAHDAVTSDLSTGSKMDYYDKGTLAGKADAIASGLFYRFGKTQAVGLKELLLQGVRFLHIKYTNYDGVWYGTHAHLCGTIEMHVTEVLEFLDSHPGEIVGLLLQPMYFGDEKYATFHKYLETIRYNGKNIYDYAYYGDVDVFNEGNGKVKISDLYYNDLTDTGTKAGVVLFDRREVSNGHDIYKPEQEGEENEYTYRFFDMDACAIHTWHSRIGADTLIEKINATAKLIDESSEYDDCLRMNQTQASFSVGGFADFFYDIGEWSLLNFADDYNVKLIENENFNYWLSQMPVFQVDFANSSKGDFNKRVNALILEYNNNLCK